MFYSNKKLLLNLSVDKLIKRQYNMFYSNKKLNLSITKKVSNK